MNNEKKKVFENLVSLRGLLHQYRLKAVKSGRLDGMMRGQGRILALLNIEPNIATSDLAYILGIRQQSLNEQIKRLEEQGLIKRQPSSEDKRVIIVSITEKGKKIDLQQAPLDDVLTEFSPQELIAFNEYLSKLIDSLASKIGEEQVNDVDNESKRIAKMKAHMTEMEFHRLMMMRKRFMGFNRFS